MINLTKEYVEERYNHWAPIAFGPEIIPFNEIEFSAIPIPDAHGHVTYQIIGSNPKMQKELDSNRDREKNIREWPEARITSIKLAMNSGSNWTEELFDKILLHEMCHIKMLWEGWVWENHEERFQEALRLASEKTGVDIPLSESTGFREEMDALPAKTKTIEETGKFFLVTKKDGSVAMVPNDKDRIASRVLKKNNYRFRVLKKGEVVPFSTPENHSFLETRRIRFLKTNSGDQQES